MNRKLSGRYPVHLPDFSHWERLIDCRAACPVRTDARGYVRAISEGDFETAYRIAREPNPFASVCGRVCAAPCEAACRRGRIDTPIAIRALKRFVTERYGVEAHLPSGKGADLESEGSRRPSIGSGAGQDHIRNLYDRSTLTDLAASRGGPGAISGLRVAVIGSGVAGLTCAHDLALLGHSVTVFEKHQTPGGMLMLGVPEYRLPRDLVRAEIQAVLDLGVELRTGQAVGRDFYLDDLRAQGFEAVFLAVGAHRSRTLRMEGVELDGVLNAVEYLLNANQNFQVDLGERVLVVGGGDVAMDVARTAARGIAVRLEAEETSGEVVSALRDAVDVAREALRSEKVRQVDIICLEDWHEVPAQRFEVEEALREGIQIHTHRGPKRILGRDGRVMGVETLGVATVFDDSGRFNPTFLPGTERTMEVDSVILAVGQAPDLDFLRPEDGVEVTPQNTIRVDPETLATTAPGVYAGGDAAFGPRIFIEGVANGHRAALSIHEYLTHRSVRPRRNGRWKPLDPFPAFLGDSPRSPSLLPSAWEGKRIDREEPETLPVERRIGVAEVELGFGPERAMAQGVRCLTCNVHPVFDGDRCILCGGCVDVCPEMCLRMVGLEEADLETETKTRLLEATLSGGSIGAATIASAILMDPDLCIRCGLCAVRCPTGAITMERFEFEETWDYADG